MAASQPQQPSHQLLSDRPAHHPLLPGGAGQEVDLAPLETADSDSVASVSSRKVCQWFQVLHYWSDPLRPGLPGLLRTPHNINSFRPY